MKYLSAALVGVLLLCVSAQAVPVTFVVRPPVALPAEVAIYVAGNFQNWQPGDAQWRLKPTDDGAYMLTADFVLDQGLQFKFTQGSWLTVEKGAGGEEIANRLHVVTAEASLEFQVASWASGQEERRADTITGHVETITVPGFLDDRRVWVYLPPGYGEQPDRHYPVLYMFDGQNVFNTATSFVGEWQVDESLERLIAAGEVAPLIVVAVDNGGDRRTEEYTPWGDRYHFYAGGGQDHLQSWVEVLLPYINSQYRTHPDPEHTGLAGSSLGGLMSLYGGFTYPETFGKVGAFSPTTHLSKGRLFEYCAEQPRQPGQIYMDMGSREEGNFTDKNKDGTDDYIEAVRRMSDVLSGRGFVGGWDLLVVEDEGAHHNEQAWSRRFPAAVAFLFPPE